MTDKRQPTNNLQIHLVAQWEKHLTNKEVARIFKACKINLQGIVEIKPGQLINNKEFTTKVHLKSCGDDGIIENSIALISFRLGPPTWDQFIRTTYRSGSNAGIRILIHEGTGFDRDVLSDPTGNVESIGLLVYNNNRCGLKTYLLEAKGLIQRIFEGKTKQIIYRYETGPTVDDNPPTQLPSIRQVQEAEFWTCYYLPAWKESYDELMGLSVNGEAWANVYQDLSLPVIWNDGGLHLNIFGDSDSTLIKLLWENKRNALKKEYPEAQIELREEPGKPYGISLRISDLPMSNLIKMGPRKKMYYAELIRDAEHNFMHFVDNILIEMRDTGKLPK